MLFADNVIITPAHMAKIKRVILKLTGKIFGTDNEPVSFAKYDKVAKQIVNITKGAEYEIAIVIGGGNILRGRNAPKEMDHTEADSMGMLATVINGVGLREALVRNGSKDARLMTSLSIPVIAEPYIRLKARDHLDQKRIIIIAGGLGIPNFSTDSAVAQYADELNCDIILKASNVDGVYDSDPHKNPKAKLLRDITYKKAMYNDLAILDKTAFAICEKSGIPVFVFDFDNLSQLPKIVKGDYSSGTLIHT